jgi:hypothetical protein
LFNSLVLAVSLQQIDDDDDKPAEVLDDEDEDDEEEESDGSIWAPAPPAPPKLLGMAFTYKWCLTLGCC